MSNYLDIIQADEVRDAYYLHLYNMQKEEERTQQPQLIEELEDFEELINQS